MPERPTLVFIFSDRQRFDTMRAYGNDWIQTPNLNILSDQSFVFENAYVTQPVCAPARSSIMTGLFPHATGVPRNKLVMRQDVQTIAEMVSDDYSTAYFGKWHLGDELVAQRGFEQWASVMDRLFDEYTKEEYLSLFTDYHHFLIENGFEPDTDAPPGKIFSDGLRSTFPAEFQQASFLAGRAERFIQENHENPFVMYVSFLEPHPPFTGPYDHLYDPEFLPVDATFLKPPEGHSLFSRLRSEFFMNSGFSNATDDETREDWERQREAYNTIPTLVGHDINDEASWRRLRAGYMGNITLVDDAVGRIVSAVDNAGLSDNTIVVFTSEHGDLVGTHGMLEMRTFYEEAAKVPCMIRLPWMNTEQKMIGGNFTQIDLVPTLLDLMGEPIPEGLHGQSRVEVLKGEATLDDNDVFIEHNGIGDRDLGNPLINEMNNLPWRSVVTADRWKLNLCAGDQCELFDLNTDPIEEHNLFDDPAQRDRIRLMATKIRLWQHQVGDDAPLPSV
ncbi:MAG: sulfatase-like hydrolase/transferase [SAR202 cluster bacterium]|jgi:arylsulfatase A-like enzyme|nr:sulfatase-like hydrolase/transferase [SAR202 cluster bacterium]